VTLRVTDANGRFDESTTLFRIRNRRAEFLEPTHGHPEWVDRAIVYGVVPMLFGPRGLPDVTARLDQIAALGVNTLWLSPITVSPPGDFGYAVTDHFRVNPRLGAVDDLHDLVRAAHARGLRVILDMVPNHLSSAHPYFVNARLRGRASPYFDYFARTQSGEATHYFDWQDLKNLNYDNPEVQRLVTAAFAHWVQTFDIDGFRIDAAWGPRERAPDFWPRLVTELKRIKPDLMLVAEASVRDPYYGWVGFDAAYDWTGELGQWAWQGAFEPGAKPASRLRSEIQVGHSGAAAVRFLENNDTGPRFVSRYGADTVRLASAMLFTLPGIPALYTGQAIGAAYEPYKDVRPIEWSNDPHHLWNWYAQLIALRLREPALRSSDIRFWDLGSSETVLAYLRPAERQQDRIVVLLNYGDGTVQLPTQSLRMVLSSRVRDELSGREFELVGSKLPLRGREPLILKSR
jgi:glycosidase